MNNSVSRINYYNHYAVLVMILSACFLFYKYILQIYPSVITNQLMRDFHLTGVGLGNLAATFYYSYMITQLFVGILLDKYSVRWLAAFAIFSCALGLILFADTKNLFIAQLSRALMGAGVAFATVAYMKLAAIFVAPRKYAVVSGLLATAAMAGAVFGQAPLAYLIDHFGWRMTLFVIGWAGFILAILYFLIVRDTKSSGIEKVAHISLREVWLIFKNKQNWLLTLYSGLAFSPIAILGGLWGNPFLQEAYHLSGTQTAAIVSFTFIGLGIGSPLLGLLSEYLQNRLSVMFVSTLISSLALLFVLYWHPLPISLVAFLLFVVGFGLGAYMLVFSIGKEMNPVFLTASVIAMINASDALLDAITEPAIGKILDLTWDGKMLNGVPYFSLHSYHIALAVLPFYLLTATLLLLWVRDKTMQE